MIDVLPDADWLCRMKIRKIFLPDFQRWKIGANRKSRLTGKDLSQCPAAIIFLCLVFCKEMKIGRKIKNIPLFPGKDCVKGSNLLEIL